MVYTFGINAGALEALLEFLASDDVKIPVCGVQIGPVHKKDVVKSSVMLEHKPEWAVILAFDVKVNRDAKVYAEKLGVKIFTADIIYHLQVRCHQLVFVCLSFASSCTSLTLYLPLSSLQDMFVAYTEECTKRKRETANDVAVFPVALGIVKCFREKNPILLGVEVLDGILKIGLSICVPAIKDEDGDPLMVGRSLAFRTTTKRFKCKKGKQVAVKIEAVDTMPLTFGRQFNKKSALFSHLTRQSIDALKENLGMTWSVVIGSW